MQVTDAKGWLALLGCGVLLATAVVWGILGRIPTKVEASGILLYSGGLADIVALGQGQISALEVEVGDTINKGQVIAEVAQPELAEQIKAHKARLEELKSNYERAKVQGGRDVGLRMQASAEERKSLESAATGAEARTRELRDRLDSQQRLFEKGLVTKETLDGTRESLRSAELTSQSMQSNRQRLIVDDFSAQRANEVAVTGEAMQVQDAQRQIQLLEEKFEQNNHIVSTYQGRVIEVRAMVGDVVAPGKPVVSLELMGEKGTIEALLYVDSRQGKTLRTGMEVQLSPIDRQKRAARSPRRARPHGRELPVYTTRDDARAAQRAARRLVPVRNQRHAHRGARRARGRALHAERLPLDIRHRARRRAHQRYAMHGLRHHANTATDRARVPCPRIR